MLRIPDSKYDLPKTTSVSFVVEHRNRFTTAGTDFSRLVSSILAFNFATTSDRNTRLEIRPPQNNLRVIRRRAPKPLYDCRHRLFQISIVDSCLQFRNNFRSEYPTRNTTSPKQPPCHSSSSTETALRLPAQTFPD